MNLYGRVMIKIYSRVKPELLLHCVHQYNEFELKRNDLISADNFIQCSALLLNQGDTFNPHKHIWKHLNTDVIAQESWVVISGEVIVTFYDIDDTILQKVVLQRGDASFTLAGGHTYYAMTDNTKVYEMKTGPYTGQVNDKIFIDDSK